MGRNKAFHELFCGCCLPEQRGMLLCGVCLCAVFVLCLESSTRHSLLQLSLSGTAMYSLGCAAYLRGCALASLCLLLVPACLRAVCLFKHAFFLCLEMEMEVMVVLFRAVSEVYHRPHSHYLYTHSYTRCTC